MINCALASLVSCMAMWSVLIVACARLNVLVGITTFFNPFPPVRVDVGRVAVAVGAARNLQSGCWWTESTWRAGYRSSDQTKC